MGLRGSGRDTPDLGHPSRAIMPESGGLESPEGQRAASLGMELLAWSRPPGGWGKTCLGSLPCVRPRFQSALTLAWGGGRGWVTGAPATPPPPPARRAWYQVRSQRGEGQGTPPLISVPPADGGGRRDPRCWRCLVTSFPVPPSLTVLAPGPAGEGVVLPAGAKRVRREKPPRSNESARSAAARRMITRRAEGGGARARAAGSVCGGPAGPESPPVWLLIARFAVTEAGGSRRPSPAPATRRVTRKHGAAPLPRPPPRAVASHFLPPARLLQFFGSAVGPAPLRRQPLRGGPARLFPLCFRGL